MDIQLLWKFLELLIICVVFVPMVYYANLLGTMVFSKKRNRGFEVISLNQWSKDVSKLTGLIDKDGFNFGIIQHSKIKLPKRATAHAAGYDVYSLFGFTLLPNESVEIPTGWKAYMNPNEKLIFHPRSGLGFKYFVRLANTTGVGDSDYYNCEKNEGHYWIKIRNEGDVELVINSGDAIAQCIFGDYKLADGDRLSGEKRIGGFGSTDKK